VRQRRRRSSKAAAQKIKRQRIVVFACRTVLTRHDMMRGRTNGHRIAMTLALAATLALTPGRAGAESLQAAVEKALSSHPELGAIRFNRHAIDHELTAARGLSLPSVDLRAAAGRQRTYDRSALGIVSGDDYHGHRDVSALLSQRLFDGFEARHEQARQQHRVESSRWRVNDTANAIALRTVQAYLEMQRALSVLDSARANLAAHERLMSRVHQRVDGGRGSASDLSEAGGRAANAKALVIEAQARAADAEALYRSATGHAPGRLEAVLIPVKALPTSVEAAVGEARVAAPSVIATEHDTTAAEAAVGVARSRFYPKLNLELSADRGWGVSENDDRSVDTRAMLVVRWNLLNGGIDKARVWEAKARAFEAAEISENTRRIVERETRVSWNAIASARSRVPVLTRQLAANRQTRSSYSAQFDAGQRRLLDLLDIQAEVFVAEATLRTEQFVHVFNSLRLLAAMGRLVPALGLELPAEAALPPAETVIDGWRDGWTNWSTRIDYHGRESVEASAAPVK